jgi:hypothetical protein
VVSKRIAAVNRDTEDYEEDKHDHYEEYDYEDESGYYDN